MLAEWVADLWAAGFGLAAAAAATDTRRAKIVKASTKVVGARVIFVSEK